MDGAKLITDTIDLRKQCGRQVFCEGRSAFESWHRPHRNKNPGGSRIIEELESLPLKGQGFLGNADQPRVSWS